MAQTYCDAFQTTKGSKNGWGDESVNCMVKHWQGEGSGEGVVCTDWGIVKDYQKTFKHAGKPWGEEDARAKFELSARRLMTSHSD